MIRLRHKGAVLLSAFVLAGAVAPAASGKVYEAQRTGFSIKVRVQAGQVTDAAVRFTRHCAGPAGVSTFHADQRFGEINARIDPSTGRFQRHVTSQAGATQTTGLRGRVRSDRLTGEFSRTTDYNPGRDLRCYSGSSFEDPWVRFVARPRAPHPPPVVYRAKRPGFSAEFEIRGLRVVGLILNFTRHHCGGRDRPGIFRAPNLNPPLRIDPDTGRFGLHAKWVGDSFTGEVRLRARLEGSRIVGRWKDRGTESPGGGKPSCTFHTGRTFDDPWVSFVARRQ